MAQTATITSASGETGFEFCPAGTGTIAVKGTITAGGICVVVRPPGASGDFVDMTIDQTAIQEVADEAGTAYSYMARFDAGKGANVALKANATFAGSITAQVTGDLV